MPELPEVETVVCDLRRSGLEGCVIQRVEFPWAKTAAMPAAAVFSKQIRGQCIQKIMRRAKFIVMELTSGWLLVHLRMTGRLDLFSAHDPVDPYVRAQAFLADGRELRFKDIRKFGRWYFYKQEPPQFKTLGPEPLEKEFTVEVLTRALSGHNRQIKPLLLDQTVVAGLGNIYVDEALWQARIHPLALSQKLKKDSVILLHRAIVDVLKRGVRNSGTTLGKNELNYYSVGKRRGRNQDELQVFRKTGSPCPRCGTAIQRLIVGQRSSHVCIRCQKRFLKP